MAEKDQNMDKTEEKDKKQENEIGVGVDAKATAATDVKKSPKKSATKSPAKAKPKPKKEPSDDEEESEDEELVGTLDQPLVIEGKRDRKSTEFLATSFTSQQNTERKPLEIPTGKGETLGSMPRVKLELDGMVAKELKPLHRLLYGRVDKNSNIKKNIRNFYGFDFDKDSKEYAKKLEMIDRFVLDSLKRLAEILDIEKKGKKDELVERVMKFLMEPRASGLAVRETKKKSTKQTGTKRKRPEKEEKSPKKKSKETVESDDEADDEEEEAVEEAKEPVAKKKKTSETKKDTKGKKETKKPTKKDKKVVPIKISPGKKGKKQKAAKEESDSDDEPLVKKKKKSPPTDDEIVELVKELLDGADLEKITMKSVCKQVFDRFPEFDLTSRKDFIKETVKEIIT